MNSKGVPPSAFGYSVAPAVVPNIVPDDRNNNNNASNLRKMTSQLEHLAHPKGRGMANTPAFLRCIQAIVGQQPLDEKYLQNFEDMDKEGVFRKGGPGGPAPFPSSGITEAFANRDVLRALMEQPDFRQACTDAGMLDEGGMEAALRFSDESGGPREYVRDILSWQFPKNITCIPRARPGSVGGAGAAMGGARKADGGKMEAFDGVSGDPHAFDGSSIAVPSIDISTLTEKLSSSTLNEVGQYLSEQAGGSSPPMVEASPTESGHLLMRRIGEASATAASQLLFYDSKKHRAQDQNDGRGKSLAETYGYPLHDMKRDRLQGLSRYLGISCTDAEGVYKAISGIGALLLFNTLPLEVLKKCCKELGINIAEDAFMDVHLLPETLAEKISAFLYPLPDAEKISLSHLMFLPRLQVNECSSGTYICSIENARNIGQLPLERYTSNRFSCNKIKWRCILQFKKDFLHLYLWHRHTSAISAHIMIRTAESKKRKGRQDNSAEKADKAGRESGSSAPLFMETEAVAEPNELVAVPRFLFLKEAMDALTTSAVGLRTYNPADDRLVFQLSLSLSQTSGSFMPLENDNSRSLSHKDSSADVGGELSQNQSSIPLSDDEKRLKALRQAISAVTEDESSAREVVSSSWQSGYRQLQYAEYREALRARQVTRERERKALLAKAGPSPELHREVEKYKQLVQTSQQQLAKLQKEKTAEEKENKKLKDKLEEARAELERLRVAHEAKTAELAKIEEETRCAQDRIAEKRKTIEQRRLRREQISRWNDMKQEEPPTVTTTNSHDALAINDFGLFLNNGPSQDPVFHTSPQPMQTEDNFAFSTGRNVGSSMDLMGGSNAPPVFSTQPHLRSFLGVDDLEVGGGIRLSPHPAGPLHHSTNGTPPLSTSPMMVNSSSNNNPSTAGGNGGGGEASSGGGIPIPAFGTMAPPPTLSPFSTNPATHTPSLYAHLDSSPAFHTTALGAGDHSSPPPHGLNTPQPSNAPPPVSAFTVTAGGGGSNGGLAFTSFTSDPNVMYPGDPHANSPPPGNQHLFYSDIHLDPFPSSAW